jgi:excisionase family DNA binding protein
VIGGRRDVMKEKILSDGRAYYSSKDLARMFSVNESTIKRWADSGKLQCFKTVGHHRRFRFEMVSDFVARYHLELGLASDDLKGILPK